MNNIFSSAMKAVKKNGSSKVSHGRNRKSEMVEERSIFDRIKSNNGDKVMRVQKKNISKVNDGKWNHDLYNGPRQTVVSVGQGSVVFLRNLPLGCTRQNIERILPSTSLTYLVGIKCERFTAEITFSSKDQASMVARELNGQIIFNKQIKAVALEEVNKNVTLNKTSIIKRVEKLQNEGTMKSDFEGTQSIFDRIQR